MKIQRQPSPVRKKSMASDTIHGSSSNVRSMCLGLLHSNCMFRNSAVISILWNETCLITQLLPKSKIMIGFKTGPCNIQNSWGCFDPRYLITGAYILLTEACNPRHPVKSEHHSSSVKVLTTSRHGAAGRKLQVHSKVAFLLDLETGLICVERKTRDFRGVSPFLRLVRRKLRHWKRLEETGRHWEWLDECRRDSVRLGETLRDCRRMWDSEETLRLRETEETLKLREIFKEINYF